MKFVVLYGRPAAGKLTIARELSGLTGFAVFDNHLVVNAALAVYPFGSPGFVALRDALWRAAFAAIARQRGIPGLIFTFNPENTVPQAFVDDLFALMAGAGVETHVFELACDEAEIEKRLTNPDRRERRKLVDCALYRRLRDDGVFDSPRMPRDRHVIDTSREAPAENAGAIAARLAAP